MMDQIKALRNLRPILLSTPPIKTITNAAGRKATPIYLVTSANPKNRDDVMNKDMVGRMTYIERKIIQVRENVIKSGSDHVHACTSMSGAEDKKKNTA